MLPRPALPVPAALASLVAVAVLVACAVSPTGRKQLLIFPENEVATMGATAFDQQKQETPISKDAKTTAYVQCVAGQLLKTMGQRPSEWEVVLFDSPQANAFALPGRKIGVYSGLLAVANNQHMLAAVVGHEIGHVIAQHSNERLSTQFATQQGMAVVQALGGAMTENKKLLYGALGLGAQYGLILPYGRKQESEADLIGLELTAKSGFDPQQAVTLWQRMSQANPQQPPQWLSTHPSNTVRINELQAHMAAALTLQQQARAGGATPNCQ